MKTKVLAKVSYSVTYTPITMEQSFECTSEKDARKKIQAFISGLIHLDKTWVPICTLTFPDGKILTFYY